MENTDISEYWNNSSLETRLSLVKDLECTRDYRKIIYSSFEQLLNIEKRLIRERFTHKRIRIEFKLECNESGFFSLVQDFYNFVNSKDWNTKDMNITFTDY